jgi:hypothetical protein
VSHVAVDKRTGKHSGRGWDIAMKRIFGRVSPVVIRRVTLSIRNLQKTAVIIIISLFTALLIGCGLQVNGSSTSEGSSTTGETGGPVETGGQIIPVPPTFQALTGCANPNTGTSNGDWGVGSDPVYTAVDNTAPIVGQPIYTSNSIFWTSRENKPGQSILLAGAFTEEAKKVRIAPIPPGTSDWQSVVKSSSSVIATIQEGTTGLSFIVPASFPAGVYGFQIEDPSASPILGLANVPVLNWAIGVPSTADPSAALMHQVHDCSVEPGEILRVFGKNFLASDQIILQATSGLAYSLSPSKLDSNSFAVSVPSNLPPATYNFWVGTAPWSATSSPPVQITVVPSPSFTVQNVACSTLVGDGATDNTSRLQLCLDWYAPLNGSNELAYIEIPQGNFVLTGGVNPHPFEVLVGSSQSSTNFLGKPRGIPPSAWFTVPQYFGMTNMSLNAPANPNLLLSAGTTTGNPLTSGHLFFYGVNFASTTDASGGRETMFDIAGPDIQVYSSTFLSNSNQDLDIMFGDGGIVSGNKITLNNWTGLAIGNSQNIIFEANEASSQNTPGQGDGQHSGGSGLSVGRSNNQYGPSALSRNIYIGYNSFENMGSNDQQVITNDGDGGSYMGPVASSTPTTVTLADDPAWNWMGTTNPGAAVIAIISGTGVGQYSFLKSYSGKSMTLLTPWEVPPDQTSLVVITQYELNMTIAHNTITNTLGAGIVLGDALEGVVEDNLLTNAGAGILISAFGSYGGPAGYGPVMNTDVLRNTLADGAGNFIWWSVHYNNAGIGIQDMPGCLESGLVIRDNVVTSLQTIYNTDGVNGVNANLIEQNQAYWFPSFYTPGFLIQDNSPPPS